MLVKPGFSPTAFKLRLLYEIIICALSVCMYVCAYYSELTAVSHYGGCWELYPGQALYSPATAFLKPHPEPDLKTHLGPTSNTSTKTGTSVPRNL